MDQKILLRESDIPRQWYNLAADLPTPMLPPLGPDGKPPVILYSTTTCPVCISARRWLIDKGIPYTEKDVGKDAAAAAELRAKGQAQGVPTTGVPVFDVGGLLIPGFDKDLIQKLLTSAPSAPPWRQA